MPIYEYQCKACGHRLESFQKISEAPLKTCPACNKTQLEKLVSAAGFQLKGGGWYRTDYSAKEKSTVKKEGPEGEKKAAPSDTKESKTNEASSSGTTERK